jgi:hypothetical protein
LENDMGNRAFVADEHATDGSLLEELGCEVAR